MTCWTASPCQSQGRRRTNLLFSNQRKKEASTPVADSESSADSEEEFAVDDDDVNVSDVDEDAGEESDFVKKFFTMMRMVSTFLNYSS